jgi:hypothetical protein
MLVPNGGQFQNRWFASAGRLIRAMVSFRFVSQRVGRFVVAQKPDDLIALKALIEAVLCQLQAQDRQQGRRRRGRDREALASRRRPGRADWVDERLVEVRGLPSLER